MLTSRVVSPCYKCSDRSVGCHAECEKYKKYRTEVEAIQEQYHNAHNIAYTEYKKTKRDQYAHGTLKK
jgi:hypothetical protein